MKRYFLIITLSALAFTVHAQWWDNYFEVKAPKYLGNYEDYYGRSIAIHGEFAVIGCVGYNNMQGIADVLQFTDGKWQRIASLTISEPEKYNQFGASVSISDNLIAVGAFYADVYGENTGAVYLYEKTENGWIDTKESAILRASVDYNHSYFGRNVEILDEYVFVSAHGDGNDDEGAVFIYKKPNGVWADTIESVKLLSPLIQDEVFGYNISIDSATLAIESKGGIFIYESPESDWLNPINVAHLEYLNESDSIYYTTSLKISDQIVALTAKSYNEEGMLYIFEKSFEGWDSSTETCFKKFPELTENQHFGFGLALKDNMVAIGNPGGNDGWGCYAGSVNILQKSDSGWHDLKQIEEIKVSEEGNIDYFGRVLRFHNSQLFVGATCNSDFDKFNGALYVYNVENDPIQFSQSQIIYPQKHEVDYINENFGRSVAIDGDYAVVGAPLYNQSIGCAYVLSFDGVSWHNIARLTASNSNTEDGFGEEVQISDDIIVVGAPGLPYSETDYEGKVYVYKKPQTGWADTTETTTIIASDTESQNKFGISIAIEDKTIVVGSDNNSAYIFESKSNDWAHIEEQIEFTVPNDWFGKKVCIRKNHIFVMANDFINIYKRPTTGWAEAPVTATLSSFNYPEFNDISVSDSFVYVFSPYNSVYIYKMKANGWADAVEDTILYSESKHSWQKSPWGVYYYCMDANAKLILVSEVSNVWGFGKYGEITAYECTSGNWLGGEITTSTVVEPVEKPEGYSGFGRSIDIDANNIIVGNVYQSAYIFKANYNLAVSKKLNVDFNVFYYNETLIIQLTSPASNVSNLKIYNLTGQQILTQTIHSANQTIDVSNLEKGYYVISVSDKAGNAVASQGVVIY